MPINQSGAALPPAFEVEVEVEIKRAGEHEKKP
jgi:hypothetical protein